MSLPCSEVVPVNPARLGGLDGAGSRPQKLFCHILSLGKTSGVEELSSYFALKLG